MNKVRRTLSAIAPFGLMVCSVVLTSSPATAGCDGTDNDIAEANRVITQLAQAETAIIGTIATMEASVVQTLALHAGQTSAYIAQNATAISTAIDEQTKRQAQVLRDVEETEAIQGRLPSVNACEGITGLAALGTVRLASELAHAQATEIETGRVTQDRAVTSLAGAATDTTSRFDLVFASYCNAERAGVDGDICSAPPELHDADLRASSLFGEATLATEASRRVATDWIRNLTVPVIDDPPPLASADTTEERKSILDHRADDARIALAIDYMNGLYANRVPAVNHGAWANAVRGLGSQSVEGSGAISHHELLRVLARERYEDPGYFVSLQGLGTENLLRELIQLQVVGLMVNWERFTLEQQRGAMEAVGLVMTVDQKRDRQGIVSPVESVN